MGKKNCHSSASKNLGLWFADSTCVVLSVCVRAGTRTREFFLGMGNSDCDYNIELP